jgi:serine/threonine protein kinase
VVFIEAPRWGNEYCRRYDRGSVYLEESFCVGMLVICAMLLVEPVRGDGTSEAVIKFRERLVDSLSRERCYSWKLKELVMRMCEVNPSDRITSNVIISYLEREEDFMVERRGFSLRLLDEIVRESGVVSRCHAKQIKITISKMYSERRYTEKGFSPLGDGGSCRNGRLGYSLKGREGKREKRGN